MNLAQFVLMLFLAYAAWCLVFDVAGAVIRWLS